MVEPLKAEDPRLAPFTCGRRGENPLANQTFPGPDTWRVSESGWHTCSYCGSVHPAEYLELAEAGTKMSGTDKSYKAYIDLPDPNPEALTVRVSQNHEPEDKTGWVQVTEENVASMPYLRGFQSQAGWWVKPEPRGAVAFGKFYYQHLDKEQQDKFIELFNARVMNFGEYGLYVTPFFCKRAESPGIN